MNWQPTSVARSLLVRVAMRLFALVAVLASCGSPIAPLAVPCGSSTCGVGFYCEATCDCCGIPDARAARGHFECKPIPVGCIELCRCPAVKGDACAEAERLVEHACPGLPPPG